MEEHVLKIYDEITFMYVKNNERMKRKRSVLATLLIVRSTLAVMRLSTSIKSTNYNNNAYVLLKVDSFLFFRKLTNKSVKFKSYRHSLRTTTDRRGICRLFKDIPSSAKLCRQFNAVNENSPLSSFVRTNRKRNILQRWQRLINKCMN